MRRLQTLSIFLALQLSRNSIVGNAQLPNVTEKNSLLVPMDSLKPAKCECGKIEKKIADEKLAKVKVVGGRVPWLAQLVTSSNLEPFDDGYRLCFGTVVSLSSVLFPASCIDRTAKTKPKVKLVWIENKNENIRNIASVKIHPGYRNKYDNDIALVKLAKVIDFNQTGIVPACLPQSQQRVHYDLGEFEGADNEIEREGDMEVGNVREEDLEDSRKRPCRNPWPPCQKRPCGCPTRRPAATQKPIPLALRPTFATDDSVIRTWFFRKGPGFPDNQYFGRFTIQKTNASRCNQLFPEMLKSKVNCVQYKEIKDIAKQNENFFKQLELGMPLIVANTTMIKGKPTSTRHILGGIRSPGYGGLPVLVSRENVIPLLKVEGYVPWIKENSHSGHFCRS